ncbi:hypothetical protein Tco_0846763 [Tanacetum coccineum]
MGDPKPDDGLVDTPLISSFLDSDDDSDDGEFLNELEEYGNAGKLCQKKDELGSTWRNLVAIVNDVYVFVGSFTYITNFMELEDIGEFILSDMTDVVMGKPFRKVTKIEYYCTKGLISFTTFVDNYTFQMPRTIPRKPRIVDLCGVLLLLWMDLHVRYA